MGEKREAIGALCKVSVYCKIDYKRDKERCGRSVSVVLRI